MTRARDLARFTVDIPVEVAARIVVHERHLAPANWRGDARSVQIRRRFYLRAVVSLKETEISERAARVLGWRP